MDSLRNAKCNKEKNTSSSVVFLFSFLFITSKIQRYKGVATTSMLTTNAFSLGTVYTELTQFLSPSSHTNLSSSHTKNKRRTRKIARYVASHNDEQRGEAYRQSIQSRITRIKRDIVTMCNIKAQVSTLFDIYEHLEETMETLVDATPLLYDKHIKHEIEALKESRVSISTPMTTLLSNKTQCANDRLMIDVAIQHLRHSYDENCKLLIRLRKVLCEEMTRMYLAFRLFRDFVDHRREKEPTQVSSCGFEQTHCVFVMRYGNNNTRFLNGGDGDDKRELVRVIFERYRRVIFSGVVLLDTETLEEAFLAIDRL